MAKEKYWVIQFVPTRRNGFVLDYSRAWFREYHYPTLEDASYDALHDLDQDEESDVYEVVAEDGEELSFEAVAHFSNPINNDNEEVMNYGK